MNTEQQSGTERITTDPIVRHTVSADEMAQVFDFTLVCEARAFGFPGSPKVTHSLIRSVRLICDRLEREIVRRAD